MTSRIAGTGGLPHRTRKKVLRCTVIGLLGNSSRQDTPIHQEWGGSLHGTGRIALHLVTYHRKERMSGENTQDLCQVNKRILKTGKSDSRTGLALDCQRTNRFGIPWSIPKSYCLKREPISTSFTRSVTYRVGTRNGSSRSQRRLYEPAPTGRLQMRLPTGRGSPGATAPAVLEGCTGSP